MRSLLLKSILTACIIELSISVGAAWALASAPQDTAETQLWRLAEIEQKELEHKAILFHQNKLDTYILHISEQLWGHAGTCMPPIQVRIIEDPELNAFAYPNGVIYLTTGVLAHTRNEDQLAAIIAHEMIHYIRRHSFVVFGVSQNPGTLSRSLSEQPDAPGREASTGDVASLVNAAERQADQEGLAMVCAAGYNPSEMLTMLTHFQQVQQQMNPEDAKRISQKISWRMRLGWIKNLLKNNTDGHPMPTSGNLSPDHLDRIAPVLLADTMACIRMGYWGQAWHHMEIYAQIRDNDPQAIYLKGKIEQHRQPGNTTIAAAYYQKAIDIKQDYAPAHLALGMMLYKAGRLQTARQHFETGLELAPHNKDNAYIRQYLKRCLEQ